MRPPKLSVTDATPVKRQSEVTMGKPYEHTITAADRVIFEKWLLGITGVCIAIALLLVGVAVVNPRTDGHRKTEMAVTTVTSPSLPPRGP
jgi:hypothetical protein